jgi:hypothetical protein
VLLAGDEIGKDEKDAVMVALNGAYWRYRVLFSQTSKSKIVITEMINTLKKGKK